MIEQKPELRVFFFGDSICFGQGVSPHLCWVTRLSDSLEQRFGHVVNLVIQNPSINGNTTRMALERIPYDVQSHAPHVLYVQFGMNDCNVWATDGGHPRTAPASFQSNLSEIVDRGRRFGASVVILGVNHGTTRNTVPMPNVSYTFEEGNRAYNELIREVARRQGTWVADAEKAFDAYVAEGRTSYADLVLLDQLHLSPLGHDVYYDSHLPVLVSAVEQALGQISTQCNMPATAPSLS